MDWDMIGFRADVKYLRREILWSIVKLNDTGQNFTVNDIANQLECDRSSILNHLKALENSGYIKVSKGRGRATSEYEILEAGKSVIGKFIKDVLRHVDSIAIS